MNKKIFLMALMLFIIPAILAVDDCTTTNNVSVSTDLNYMESNVTQSFTIGSDQKFSSLVNLTANQDVEVQDVCENFTITNQTTAQLQWVNIDNGNISIRNSTDGVVIGTKNYTLDYTLGQVTWNTSTNNFNNTLAEICYNVTIYDGVTDLTDSGYSFTYELGSNTAYGDDTTIMITEGALNNTNWTTFFNFVERTCNTRNSCASTQVTIYAGLSLIALIGLVVAAFLLINVFQGGWDTTVFIATIIGLIGLGIIVMIGYYIIYAVGANVCVV